MFASGKRSHRSLEVDKVTFYCLMFFSYLHFLHCLLKYLKEVGGTTMIYLHSLKASTLITLKAKKNHIHL